MKHLARSLLAVALLSTPAIARGDGPAAPSPATPNRPTYPPTPTGSVTYVMHGETIADPYRWLEDNKSNDVVEWDRAQQALTRARLDGFSGRAAWKARIDAELDLPSPPSLPAFEGGREWWTERPAGANLGVVYARSDDGTGEPKVMLDPNSWTKDGTAGLRGRYPSPDGKWLAYFRDA